MNHTTPRSNQLAPKMPQAVQSYHKADQVGDHKHQYVPHAAYGTSMSVPPHVSELGYVSEA